MDFSFFCKDTKATRTTALNWFTTEFGWAFPYGNPMRLWPLLSRTHIAQCSFCFILPKTEIVKIKWAQSRHFHCDTCGTSHYMRKHECYMRYRNRRRKMKTNRKNVWMRYGRYVCAYRVWQWYVCLQCDCWCATWDMRVERAILCVVCVMTFCHSYGVSCYQWNVVRIFATVIFSSLVPICVSVV